MQAETNVQTQPQAIQIRNLLIDPPLLLAPMAGLTHSAFRRIVIGFGGVGLLSTEMLSAKRLPTENPRISPYLIRTERESPLSYQLLTSTDKEIGRAIDALHAFKADAIDLNMGCPSRAVSKFGAGSTSPALIDCRSFPYDTHQGPLSSGNASRGFKLGMSGKSNR